MSTRTLMACAAAVVLVSNANAEEINEKGSEDLERPPAFSKTLETNGVRKASQRSAEGSRPDAEDAANDEELEPTVTIKEQGEVTVYEYRLNGLLYGVKIVPKNAPAYYLVDTDGDGFMDRRRNDLKSPEMNRVPAWVLFKW